MIFDSRKSDSSGSSNLAGYLGGLLKGADPSCDSSLELKEMARAFEAYASLEGGGMLETRSLAVMMSTAASAIGLNQLADDALLLGSGIIYPQRLQSAGSRSAWVVDSRRLFPDFSQLTELGVFSVFYTLIGRMSHLWDEASGDGVLGVRKFRSISMSLAGTGAKRDVVTSCSSRLFDALSRRLAQCAEARGWRMVPSLLMLD